MTRLRLPIQNPCHEDWNAMTGDARRRHCDVCQKNVHHLSSMTEAEARDLLATAGDERVCVRYACNADGTVRFRPERPPTPAPIPASLRRLATPMLATMLAACTPHGKAPEPEISDPVEVVMGAVPVVPDAPPPIEMMGEVAIEPDDEPCGAEDGVVEAPAPEPRMGRVKMGKIPAVAPEPKLMGDVAPEPMDG